MGSFDKHNYYDSEPVLYCAKCYSLKIGYEELIDSDCCLECGCSDILSTSIDEWTKLYEQRYGHPFVVRRVDPRKALIMGLSFTELREIVYNSQLYREIITKLYPTFPEGLSKADSIILFFDKLVKDNRLADLKLLLLDYIKF